jgi:hypothetical protein
VDRCTATPGSESDAACSLSGFVSIESGTREFEGRYRIATSSSTDGIAGGAAQTLTRCVHETFDTPQETGKNAHARMERTSVRKIMLIPRIDTVYFVGMFRLDDDDDTHEQSRNASKTA